MGWSEEDDDVGEVKIAGWRFMVAADTVFRIDFLIGGILFALYGLWILLKGLFLGLLKVSFGGLLIMALGRSFIQASRRPLASIVRDVRARNNDARFVVYDFFTFLLWALLGILGLWLSWTALP